MKSQFPTAVAAATVVLIRPAVTGFEVYLLKRSTQSKFMAGNFVFPGGMVDASDGDDALWADHMDMDLKGVERRLGGRISAQEVLGYAVAVIRETFEEAGVLLAHRKGAATGGLQEANRLRDANDFKPGWFFALAKEQGWCLDSKRLFRWAHWITPPEMKRRYDTRFFVAAMPPDQTCRPDAGETTEGVWMRPLDGLEANMAGRISLSPPTVVTLQALTKFGNHEALQEDICNREWGLPLRPRMVSLPRGAVIVEPWDPEFDQEDIEIDPDTLDDKLLPVGVDFSRIWLHKGLWRPVDR